MIRVHFFYCYMKHDVLEISRTIAAIIKPRRSIIGSPSRKTITYCFAWLWFALSFERDIAKTKWRNLYKEKKENA